MLEKIKAFGEAIHQGFRATPVFYALRWVRRHFDLTYLGMGTSLAILIAGRHGISNLLKDSWKFITRNPAAPTPLNLVRNNVIGIAAVTLAGFALSDTARVGFRMVKTALNQAVGNHMKRS